jgi:hypothetical protein
MKKFLLVAAVCTVSFFVVTAQSPGSTMYVGIKKAEVKASTGFFSSLRGTLEMGSPVTVLRSREKWMEIRSANPALSGWVASAALTGKRVTASGFTPGAGEVAMAGKGFSGEVEQIYREGEQLDYSSVDLMESFVVPREELYTFLTEGRLITGE